MTLKELKELDKDFLTPAEVAAVTGMDPQRLRLIAHKHKERLGFPVILSGRKTIIPKAGFIKFCEGG